jgi:hypothetical protein
MGALFETHLSTENTLISIKGAQPPVLQVLDAAFAYALPRSLAREQRSLHMSAFLKCNKHTAPTQSIQREA